MEANAVLGPADYIFNNGVWMASYQATANTFVYRASMRYLIFIFTALYVRVGDNERKRVNCRQTKRQDEKETKRNRETERQTDR